MKEFAQLFAALDSTTRTNEKVDALATYFGRSSPRDAAWAIYFLSGRKPRRAVSTTKLRTWAAEVVGISEWLFAECYDSVGDLAETVALLLPPPRHQSEGSFHEWVESRLIPLRDMEEAEQRTAVLAAWDELDLPRRFIWNKLITGGFRVGVSQLLVSRALAKIAGLPQETIAHRLMGDWEPTEQFYSDLIRIDTQDTDASRPYPFFLASPLEGAPESLGSSNDWQAEWKWDGIRAQWVSRGGMTFLWSRGEELVTDRFPELQSLAGVLPEGLVLDGEILPWQDDHVLSFAHLQRRIGRKKPGKKLLEEIPVRFLAYDVLEAEGRDLRFKPLRDRRSTLESIVSSINDHRLQVSPVLTSESWEVLAASRLNCRSLGVEGLMLKHRDSAYEVGRVRGTWWKWKIEPYAVDGVLMYAQRGHGRRASLYSDYTFGVWDGGRLVPFAKAYSGLTDQEMREVDAFIRGHTVEKFGPVRTVKPELVFEVGFEGIQQSKRHRCGVAVRFPRMLRWRTDKTPDQADTLDRLKAMLAVQRT